MQHLVVTGRGQGGAVVAEVDRLDDVLVLEGQLLLAAKGVPHLHGETETDLFSTLAEKSAAPVAALVASRLTSTPQTAPLWPSKVPIQSPVSPWGRGLMSR